MKSKKILIATIIFFLIINTAYYWEGKLGIIAFPVFMLLFISYIVLAAILMWQVYLAINEKFSNKFRLFTAGFLLFVLIATFIKPLGIIDFDKLEGEDVLIAESEGAANCTTVLKLKDNLRLKKEAYVLELQKLKEVIILGAILFSSKI